METHTSVIQTKPIRLVMPGGQTHRVYLLISSWVDTVYEQHLPDQYGSRRLLELKAREQGAELSGVMWKLTKLMDDKMSFLVSAFISVFCQGWDGHTLHMSFLFIGVFVCLFWQNKNFKCFYCQFPVTLMLFLIPPLWVLTGFLLLLLIILFSFLVINMIIHCCFSHLQMNWDMHSKLFFSSCLKLQLLQIKISKFGKLNFKKWVETTEKHVEIHIWC